MAAQSSRNLTQLKLQAKELREAHRAGDTTACARFRAHLHRLPNSTDAEIRQYALSLREAQHVIARENGFDSWATLKNQTRAPSTSETITRAVVTDQQLTDFFFGKSFTDDELDGESPTIPKERWSLTPLELEFIRAAASPAARKDKKGKTRADRWSGICDVDRMAQLADREPALLQSVGKLLLRTTVAMRGCQAATEFLLNRGVPLTISESGYNPLHEAGWAGCTENLRLVFESGAAEATIVGLVKPHEGWPDNYTLMYWAAWGGYVDMARLLISHGASIHHELRLKGNGSRGSTALQEAVAPGPWAPDHQFRSNAGKVEVARVLMDDGAYYDIYSACALNDKGRLEGLLAADATLADQPDDYKMRPLHWAARAGASDCVAALLQRGVEIEAIDKSKATPLHFAAHNGKSV